MNKTILRSKYWSTRFEILENCRFCINCVNKSNLRARTYIFYGQSSWLRTRV
uniref:Uncharacterized protein n=1 Tax=Lepeophtheirus salmonis TaxID=72036 RepID=A0A0K2TGM8_LEPSM